MQILSTRVDLVPEEYMLEIGRLQNSVPPFPTDEANEVMTRAWGAPTSMVCDDIASSPIAAASLSQVYRARLNKKYGGHVVAIKVLRPGTAPPPLIIQTLTKCQSSVA